MMNGLSTLTSSDSVRIIGLFDVRNASTQGRSGNETVAWQRHACLYSLDPQTCALLIKLDAAARELVRG